MMTHREKVEKLQRFESALEIFKLIITSPNFNALSKEYTGVLELNSSVIDDDLQNSFYIFLEHKKEFESMLGNYSFNVHNITEHSITIRDDVTIPTHIPFF